MASVFSTWKSLVALIALVAIGCGATAGGGDSPTPDIDALVEARVEAALTAVPTATIKPTSTPTSVRHRTTLPPTIPPIPTDLLAPTRAPAAPASTPQVELLEGAISGYITAALRGETLVAYTYLDESVKMNCSAEQYSEGFGFLMLFGGFKDKEIEYNLSEAHPTSDGMYLAKGELLVDGRPLDVFGDHQGYWIWHDENWWITGAEICERDQ